MSRPAIDPVKRLQTHGQGPGTSTTELIAYALP
ncbi:MAG: hypothetical protein ETSY2_38075 [Candidatus Entotheonella gemina]|uniref:Uncharacterized protein n=1 Tax=Candidatus Entotheonella gemina TaxID=1429439 RepID=W4LSB7_9BACT|nr:MAG: hypothetical protein ETSY2_38075 [Candidatus Entotheonella gemina]